MKILAVRQHSVYGNEKVSMNSQNSISLRNSMNKDSFDSVAFGYKVPEISPVPRKALKRLLGTKKVTDATRKSAVEVANWLIQEAGSVNTRLSQQIERVKPLTQKSRLTRKYSLKSGGTVLAKKTIYYDENSLPRKAVGITITPQPDAKPNYFERLLRIRPGELSSIEAEGDTKRGTSYIKAFLDKDDNFSTISLLHRNPKSEALDYKIDAYIKGDIVTFRRRHKDPVIIRINRKTGEQV